MENRVKVCHFTSVHDAYDDRIYLKECISLEKAGYEVWLVARGKNAIDEGIKIFGCGTPKNRWDRFFLFSSKIYRKARELDCDLYHFHDPELLPYGLKLKRQGKKVIFDSHEDIPAQIIDKYWIPKSIRKFLSWVYKKYESFVVKQLDAVVTATEHIADCFMERAQNVVVINNYPKLNDIVFHDKSFSERKNIVCYAGGISEMRGEKVMIGAMKSVNADLILAGEHNIISFPNGEDKKIEYIGKISRDKINELYGNSRVGLLLYQPAQNHYEAQPIKMFEYMAAGIPLVASDFPLWRKIIEGEDCGICVNCENIDEVRAAIEQLLVDSHKSQNMGKNGRKAVETKYNWEIEKEKLIEMYAGIQEKT